MTVQHPQCYVTYNRESNAQTYYNENQSCKEMLSDLENQTNKRLTRISITRIDEGKPPFRRNLTGISNQKLADVIRCVLESANRNECKRCLRESK